MTKPHPWVRTSRALLCLVIGFIVISALNAWRQDGFSIATDLSDMVPSTSASAAHQLALDAAQDNAEQSIVLMLESAEPQSLQQAVAWIDNELATMSARLLRQNPADLTQLIVDELAAYRFHLLTPDDRTTLASDDVDSVLERALGELYSPGGGLRLLPLDQDPFNFFSRYIEDSVGKVGVPGQDTTQPVDIATEAGNSMYREVITLRLTTTLSEAQKHTTLSDFFNRLDTEIKTRHPTVELLRTGVLFFANEAASGAKKDINFISAGSIVGVSLLMMLVFRSISPLVTATVSIALGVGFAFTVVHLIYGSIHVFTIVFGASLIGIVIDYSIHYYYHCIAGVADHKDNKRLYRALLISLVTSIAGFSALLFSSVAMLQKIAIFSICGITAAWLTVLALAPSKAVGTMKVRHHLVDPIAQALGTVGATIIERFDSRIAVAVLATILASVVWLGKGQDDPRSFIDLSDELLQQNTRISKHMNDLEPGIFFVVEADTEQRLFDRLDALYTSVGTSARMVSVFDWLPSPSDQQLNYQAQAVLFDQAGPVEEFYLATGASEQWFTTLQDAYQSSAATPLTSGHFFNLLSDRMSPMVLTSKDSAERNSAMAAYVLLGTGSDLESIKASASGIEGVSYIDTVADSTTQLHAQRISAVWLLLLAYAAVGMLMWLLYRDRRALVMTALPAVSTVLTLGVLLLMGQPLTLFHTMSLFLILGLGMDYVVFLNEMTDDQKITRQAIVLSGLTSMLSFGLLAVSSVPVAKAFGLTVLIGNSFNLVATLGLANSANWQRKVPNH